MVYIGAVMDMVRCICMQDIKILRNSSNICKSEKTTKINLYVAITHLINIPWVSLFFFLLHPPSFSLSFPSCPCPFPPLPYLSFSSLPFSSLPFPLLPCLAFPSLAFPSALPVQKQPQTICKLRGVGEFQQHFTKTGGSWIQSMGHISLTPGLKSYVVNATQHFIFTRN